MSKDSDIAGRIARPAGGVHMRRTVLGSLLVLAASLMIGSAASADHYELDGAGAPAVGVEYTVGSGIGELTVIGAEGMPVEAYDANGVALGGSMAFDSVTKIALPQAGTASIYVRVGEQWYECSVDDDWAWQ